MRAVERRIARISARQDNAISLEQLLEAGLGHDAVAYRVTSRSMQRLHGGVFLLGAAPPTPMARARAAVMACGEGAVVSHRSAAEMFGLLPASGKGVDVTVVGRNPGSVPRDSRSAEALSLSRGRAPGRLGTAAVGSSDRVAPGR
jgi:hypothetical protein